MYLRTYNSDHLVIQFQSVASTTSKVALAFRTNAYFVVPDITILKTHPVIFFKDLAV